MKRVDPTGDYLIGISVWNVNCKARRLPAHRGIGARNAPTSSTSRRRTLRIFERHAPRVFHSTKHDLAGPNKEIFARKERNRAHSLTQAYNDDAWDDRWEAHCLQLGGNSKEGVDRKGFTLLCAVPPTALARGYWSHTSRCVYHGTKEGRGGVPPSSSSPPLPPPS